MAFLVQSGTSRPVYNTTNNSTINKAINNTDLVYRGLDDAVSNESTSSTYAPPFVLFSDRVFVRPRQESNGNNNEVTKDATVEGRRIPTDSIFKLLDYSRSLLQMIHEVDLELLSTKYNATAYIGGTREER